MKKGIGIILFIFFFNSIVVAENFGPWNSVLVKKEIPPKKFKKDKSITNPIEWGFIRFIRFFQIYISPQDGPNCRYHPTCSQYTLLAIKKYGPLLGIIMGADRLLRCNPLGAWGRDLPEENYFWGKHQ